jgi:hypothetical protein
MKMTTCWRVPAPPPLRKHGQASRAIWILGASDRAGRVIAAKLGVAARLARGERADRAPSRQVRSYRTGVRRGGGRKSAGVNRRPHQCFVKLNLMVSAGCEPTSGSYALGVLVNSLWSVPHVEHLGKSQYRREHRWPPKLKDIGQSARAKWS